MIPEPLYLVYSAAHKGWWRPNSMGYCVHHSDAGRYPKAEADDICLHGDGETCFPETDPRFHSTTPRADALIAELAYQFPATEGYQRLEEVKRMEEELTQTQAALDEADADCAQHNLYTAEESQRAVTAIRAAEKWGESTYASWHDRVWWVEQMKEIARLRAALETIASYDQNSLLGEKGICPYGCDCPHIAQSVLGLLTHD